MPRPLAFLTVCVALAASAAAFAGSPQRTLMTSAPRVLSVSQITNVDGSSEFRGFVGPLLNTSVGTTSAVGASDLNPAALHKLLKAPIFRPTAMPDVLYDPVAGGNPNILVDFAVTQGYLPVADNAPISEVALDPAYPPSSVTCDGSGNCYDTAVCTQYSTSFFFYGNCATFLAWPAYCTAWGTDAQGHSICTSWINVPAGQRLVRNTTKNLQTYGSQPQALRDLIAQRWMANEKQRLLTHFTQIQGASPYPGAPAGRPLAYYIGRSLTDYIKANGLASATYAYKQFVVMPATGETWALIFQLRALPNGSVSYGDAIGRSLTEAMRVLVLRYSSVRQDEDIPPQWANTGNPHGRVPGRLSWHVEENNVPVEADQYVDFADGRFDPPVPVEEGTDTMAGDALQAVRCLVGTTDAQNCPAGTPDTTALMSLKRAGSVLLIYDEPLADKSHQIPDGVDENGAPAYRTISSLTTAINFRELTVNVVPNPNPGPATCFQVVGYQEAGTWAAEVLDTQRRYVRLLDEPTLTERSVDELKLTDSGSYSITAPASGKLADYVDPAMWLAESLPDGSGGIYYPETAIDKTGQLVPSTVRAPLSYRSIGGSTTGVPECQ